MVLTLREGDRLLMLSGGGGGYGDPLDRDPELVREDVLGRKISMSAAREDYGVVIDERTHAVRADATQELRHRRRTSPSSAGGLFDRGTTVGA
jgi:N-methylhydantoinase B